MQFESLRELHRRVTAPQSDNQVPRPLESAFLIAVPESVPALQSYPVKTAIFLYNCGAQNGRLISVETLSSGVRVLSHTRAEMLPAYTSLDHAFRCDVELHPLELIPAARSAEFVVRWRNMVSLKIEVTAVSLQYTRQSGDELEIGFDTPEVHFDDLWVDDLRVFALTSIDAKTASLYIETGPAKGVYPMIRREGQLMAGVAIPRDAEAHYRFSVDGRFSTDETVLETTHIPGVDTACTPLSPAGLLGKTVKIKNIGAIAADLTIDHTERWLQCSLTKCRLEPGASQDIVVSVFAGSLIAGEYVDTLRVIASAGRITNIERTLTVRVTLRAAGPICRNNSDYQLGVVHFGDQKKRTISVKNPSASALVLEGVSEDRMVSVPRQQIEPGNDAELPLHFDFSRMSPANSIRESRLIIQTNAWVESRRKLEITLSYKLVALQTTPEYIDFGVLSGAETRTFSVSASLGDGTMPVSDLRLEKAPPWITWKRESADGLYSLSVSGDGLAAQYGPATVSLEQGRKIQEELVLREKEHGASGTLPVRGLFAHPRALAKTLKFGVVKLSKQLPLPVANAGLGNLVIRKIELDVPWLQVTANAESESRLQIIASRTRLFGKQEGSILVHTNDPRSSLVVVPVKAEFGG